MNKEQEGGRKGRKEERARMRGIMARRKDEKKGQEGMKKGPE